MMSLKGQVNVILNSERIPSFHVNEESKNSLEQLKNSVTNVTSVTGEGFRDDQSSPDRHFPSSECHFALEIEYGVLVEEYKNNRFEGKIFSNFNKSIS